MKIKSYENDTNISLTDKLLGSDSDNSNETKTYTFQEIKDFLIAQGLGVSSPIVTGVEKTTITSAQILQLYTTPIVILDSSEAGKVKYPTNVYVKRHAGNAYTLVNNSFSILNDMDTQMSANLNPNPLANTSTGYFQSEVNVDQNLSGGDKCTYYVLKANSGNPTNGTGDIDVYVTYVEITL